MRKVCGLFLLLIFTACKDEPHFKITSNDCLMGASIITYVDSRIENKKLINYKICYTWSPYKEEPYYFISVSAEDVKNRFHLEDICVKIALQNQLKMDHFSIYFFDNDSACSLMRDDVVLGEDLYNLSKKDLKKWNKNQIYEMKHYIGEYTYGLSINTDILNLNKNYKIEDDRND